MKRYLSNAENSKKETAMAFVGLHKNSDVEQWQPLAVFDDDKWLAIYDNLVGDSYGCIEISGDGNNFTIEISGDETTSGIPFTFEADYL